MLPFSKRKNAGEEIELDDDDLVLVESPPPSFASSSPPPRLLGRGAGEAQMPAPAQPRGVMASVSRRIIDVSIADGVAGECLSAIAAASRDRDSSSHVRAAIARPRPPSAPPPRAASAPPPASLVSATAAPTSRLPSVSPPPFVRTSTTRLGRPASPSPERAQAPSSSTHESSRPPAFIRRSSPMIAVTRTAPGSDAPMSLSPRTAAPTVIVVRERPKAAWVIGAATIGAVFAVLASRLVMANDAPVAAAPPPPTSVAVPGVAAPLAAVVAPVTPATPVAPPSASVAVMRFGDDQGVAFKAPPRPPVAPATPLAAPEKVAQAPSSASAPRPRASAVGPTLPDGSLSLAGAPVSTTRTSSPAVPTPVAPPPAAPKRALTPEQQLAEAQLKASMR